MISLKDLYNQLNEKFESFWDKNIESKIPNTEILNKIRERTDLMPLILTIFVVGIYLFLNPVVENTSKEEIINYFNLTVSVYNFDEPLENATVILYKEDKEYDKKITSSDGLVVFNDLEQGNYLVVLEYNNITKNQSVYLNKNKKIIFQLEVPKNKNISLKDYTFKVYYSDGLSVGKLDKVVIEFKDGVKKTFEYVPGSFNLKDLLNKIKLYGYNDIKAIYVYKGDCSGMIIDLHQSKVFLQCQKNKEGKYKLHLSVFGEGGIPLKDIKVLLYLGDQSVKYKTTDENGRVVFELDYGTNINKISILSNGMYESKVITLNGTVEGEDKVIDNTGKNIWKAVIVLNKIYDKKYNMHKIKIVDQYGNPLSNHLIFIEANGKNKTYYTDEKGILTFIPPEGEFKIYIPAQSEDEKPVIVYSKDIKDEEIKVDNKIKHDKNKKIKHDKNKVCVFVKLNNNYVEGAEVVVGDNEYLGKTDKFGKFCFVPIEDKYYDVFVKYIKNNTIYSGKTSIKFGNKTIYLEKESSINKLIVNLKYNDAPINGYVYIFNNKKLIDYKECFGSCEFLLKSGENYKIQAHYDDEDITVNREIKLNKDTNIVIDFYVEENKYRKLIIIKDTRGNYLKNKKFNVTVYLSYSDYYTVQLITNNEGKAILDIKNGTKRIKVIIPSDKKHKGLIKTIYDLSNLTYTFVLEYKEPNTCVIAKVDNKARQNVFVYVDGQLYGKTNETGEYCFYLERSAKILLTYVDKYYYERTKWISPGKTYVITLEKSNKLPSTIIVYTKYNDSYVNSTIEIDGKTFECNGKCNISMPIGEYNIELIYYKGLKKYILNKKVKFEYNKTNKYVFDFYEIDDKKRINFVLNITNFNYVKNKEFNLKVYCGENILLDEDLKIKSKEIKRHLDLYNSSECNIIINLISEDNYYYIYKGKKDFDYNNLNVYNIEIKKYNKTKIKFRTLLRYKDGKEISINPDWFELVSDCYYNKEYTDKTKFEIYVPVCGNYTIIAYRKGIRKELKLEYDKDIGSYVSNVPKNEIYFDPIDYSICLDYYYIWNDKELDKNKLKVFVNNKEVKNAKWIKEYKQCFNLEELRNYSVDIYLDGLYGSKKINELESNKTFFVVKQMFNSDYKYIVLHNINRSLIVETNKIVGNYTSLAYVVKLEINLDPSSKLKLENFKNFEVIGFSGNCSFDNSNNVIYNCTGKRVKGYLDIKLKGIKVNNISFDYYFETPTGNTNKTKVSIEVNIKGIENCVGNEKYVCFKDPNLNIIGDKIDKIYLGTVNIVGSLNIIYNNTEEYKLVMYIDDKKVSEGTKNVSFNYTEKGKHKVILKVVCDDEEKELAYKNFEIENYKNLEIFPSKIYYIEGCANGIDKLYLIGSFNDSNDLEIASVSGILFKDNENKNIKKDSNGYYIDGSNIIFTNQSISIIVKNKDEYFKGSLYLLKDINKRDIKVIGYINKLNISVPHGYRIDKLKIGDYYYGEYENINNETWNEIKNNIIKDAKNNEIFLNLTLYREYNRTDEDGKKYEVKETLVCKNVPIEILDISSEGQTKDRYYYLRWYEIGDKLNESEFNGTVFMKETKVSKDKIEYKPMIWSSKDIKEFLKLVYDEYCLKNNISESLLKSIQNNKKPIENLTNVLKINDVDILCGSDYCEVKFGEFKMITGLGEIFNNVDELKSLVDQKDKVIFEGDGKDGLVPATEYKVDLYLNYSNSKIPNLVLVFKKIGEDHNYLYEYINQTEFLPFFDKLKLVSVDPYADEKDKKELNKTWYDLIKEGSFTKYFDDYIVKNKNNNVYADSLYLIHRFIKDNDKSDEYEPIILIFNGSDNGYCDKDLNQDIAKKVLCKYKGKKVLINWNNKYKNYSKRAFIIFGVGIDDKKAYYILWLGNDANVTYRIFDILDKGLNGIDGLDYVCNGKDITINKEYNVSCGKIKDNSFYVAVVDLYSKIQINNENVSSNITLTKTNNETNNQNNITNTTNNETNNQSSNNTLTRTEINFSEISEIKVHDYWSTSIFLKYKDGYCSHIHIINGNEYCDPSERLKIIGKFKNYDVVCGYYNISVSSNVLSPSNFECTNKYLAVLNGTILNLYQLGGLLKLYLNQDTSPKYYGLNKIKTYNIVPGKEYLFHNGFWGNTLYGCKAAYKTDCFSALKDKVDQKSETAIIRIDKITKDYIYANLEKFVLAGSVKLNYKGIKYNLCDNYYDKIVGVNDTLYIKSKSQRFYNCWAICSSEDSTCTKVRITRIETNDGISNKEIIVGDV